MQYIKFNSTHIGESWLKQWNIDNPEMINKKILLMPARITHWKGIEFFLELIKHLNNNDIFGLVIGKVAANKNRYLQTLKNSAKRLGLNDQNIKFLDARPDIENLYKLSALVFNLSNKPEPFGRTIIEAAACGTSVIGWDRGGVSESLKKLNSSGAVKFGDMNELIGTTKRLLDSPDIINLPKEFTKDFQTSATIEFYKSLLSNSS